MAGNENTPDERTREVEELRARLNEAEETLRAIRSGEVDTLVVSGPRGDQVFTLQGADLPYRVFLEEMSEGALTLSNEGLVLFCNRRFAELVKMPLGLVIGSTFASLLTPGQAEPFAALLREGLSRRVEGEITARAADGTLVPLRLAIDPSRADGSDRVCVVARDLTETKAMAASMRRVREGLEQAVVERTAALNSTIRELDASRVAALNLMEDAVAARDQTERASLALRESESQFRSLVEGAPNAIFVQVELRFSYVNSAACRLFGADSPEQLQGQPVMDRFHPSVWETARRRIRTPNEEMESVPLIPETWIRLDGSEVPVDVTAVPITYQGKDGVLVFAHDITVRRLGDEQQALAMRVLAALNRGDDFTELIRDILLLVKEHTGMEAVGIRLREGDDFPYCETNGFPGSFVDAERHLCARDAAGEIVRDADGNPVLECMCGTVIRGRTNPSKPFFTRGGSFWTNGTTQLLASTTETDRQGPTRNRCNGQGYESVALVPLRSDAEVIGLLQLNDRRKDMFTSNTIAFFEGLGASIGIALSRRRAIAAVRESEVRAQSLFEASPDAVFVVGAHGQFLEVNSVAVSRYGYSREELLAMSPSDLAVPNLRDEVPGRVAPARELVTRFDWEHRRKDGSAFPVEIITSPFVLGGQPSVLAVVRDVTERKKAHAERDKLQEQLRISQKMDAIGSLAGGVAHDFNNLLSVILGYTDLALADFPEGDPIRGNLLEIKKSGERAAALTRQLLAFSRKQILQPVSLDLNQIASGVDMMLRRILGEDIELLLRLAPGLGLTLADPGQIEQVIVNLAVNARDAMPMGGKLTIETANVELNDDSVPRHVGVTPGPYVLLAVSDTGHGMDELTQHRCFEPFFTTKPQGKGTGLGLSTVYGIVKQSGGNIYLYSEPGRGTTFKIYLPRELAAAATPATAPLVVTPTRGTETILVVEDEGTVRKLVQLILGMAGYTVLAAASGSEALLACERHQGPIHLVLTDVVMPEMGGRVFVEHLARVRPEAKVLYMSGYTADAIVHHGALDPGIHFIGKPFTSANLTRKVREVLGGGIQASSRPNREVVPADSASRDQTVSQEALRSLPEDVAIDLQKAVVAARYDEMIEIVERLRLTAPEVAGPLRRLVDGFDYNGILDLLGRKGKEGGRGGQ